MDHKGATQDGSPGLKDEELPQMDGSCDACEPDEAQPATLVCHTCSFAFCPLHAEKHSSSTRHALAAYEGVETNEAEEVTNLRPAPLGSPVVTGHESHDAREKEESLNSVPHKVEDGAEGADAAAEAEGGKSEGGKKKSVTVERLRCKQHGEEGSLYCKPDEKIICVVCAVQGEHREHEIITLREAYMWQKSREGYDLVGYTQQMGERITNKWTSGEMTTDELEVYVDDQFEELRQLVVLEEKRTLHLVDLKEAFLTASAAEKIAEISVETEKLQEEMASITHQLCLLEQADALGLSDAAALEALPKPAPRAAHDIEARPRLPEPRAQPVNPQDFEDNDSGPSMDHAP